MAAGTLPVTLSACVDTYLLSAILQDWDDDHCLQILRNCPRGIQHTGTRLVVGIVLSDDNNVHDTYRNCHHDAKSRLERTEYEFREVLTRAGFKLIQVVGMRAFQSVLVAENTRPVREFGYRSPARQLRSARSRRATNGAGECAGAQMQLSQRVHLATQRAHRATIRARHWLLVASTPW